MERGIEWREKRLGDEGRSGNIEAMPVSKNIEVDKDFHKEVRDLRVAARDIHHAIRLDLQTRRAMSLAFLKGVASALGAIATVVIIMPLVVWILQHVAWPPVIADIVTRVIHQLEQSSPPSPR